MNLVHHVCKEAEGLESLFLISKSNCAFANFKTEEKCLAGQQRIHDSKFQNIRLVSRLRKSTAEGVSGATVPPAPTAIAATTTSSPESEPTESQTPGEQSMSSTVENDNQNLDRAHSTINGSLSNEDKYFILKSLTMEDLDLSVRTCRWATQPHNEETLNKAFEVRFHRPSMLALVVFF